MKKGAIVISGSVGKRLQESSNLWHEGKNDPTPFIKYLLGIVLSAHRDFEQRVMDIVSKKQTIENALKKLTEQGEIERHGNEKNTFYIRK